MSGVTGPTPAQVGGKAAADRVMTWLEVLRARSQAGGPLQLWPPSVRSEATDRHGHFYAPLAASPTAIVPSGGIQHQFDTVQGQTFHVKPMLPTLEDVWNHVHIQVNAWFPSDMLLIGGVL